MRESLAIVEERNNRIRKNIKMRMFDSSLSGKAMSEKSGICQTTLIKKLKYPWKFTIEELTNIARILNTTPEELITGGQKG